MVELEVARQRRKERYITHRSNLGDWSVVERPRVVVYAMIREVVNRIREV